MKGTYFKIPLVLILVSLLSGCLFPESELAKNQVPHESQLEMVQTAVDEYIEITGGLVPIKTKGADTPIFEKYMIDFDLLKEQHLLGEIPGNAYENGGIYQYVIITPEEDPRVKLIDLRTAEAIRKVDIKLEIYRQKNIYPPFGQEIEKGLYTIDYEALGLKSEPYAVSPFTDNNLPIIMNTDGRLYIDYRKDLRQALDEHGHSLTKGDDIRYILPDHSPFVPAFSLPYTVQDDEPIFLLEN